MVMENSGLMDRKGLNYIQMEKFGQMVRKLRVCMKMEKSGQMVSRLEKYIQMVICGLVILFGSYASSIMAESFITILLMCFFFGALIARISNVFVRD